MKNSTTKNQKKNQNHGAAPIRQDCRSDEVEKLNEFQKNMKRHAIATKKLQVYGLDFTTGGTIIDTLLGMHEHSCICRVDTRKFPLTDGYDILDLIPEIKKYINLKKLNNQPKIKKV